jgi:DNA mismatch repair protein MutS2
LDNAKIEAYEIIRNANALIENTIREIRQQQKPIAQIKSEFQAVKKELEEQARKVFDSLPQSVSQQIPLREGDFVSMDNPTNTGQILKIYEDTGEALVDFNGLKFKTKLNRLTKIDAQNIDTQALPTSYVKFSGETRIDVRGLRANDAIREVDKFISEAILSNISNITIIHGKGTGALRTALHQFLETHPQVESFREGTIEEGGAGVTVVILR